MKKLAEVKKEMLKYARTVVDLEEGETPRDWVNTYIQCLQEDGLIVKVGKTLYVKEA